MWHIATVDSDLKLDDVENDWFFSSVVECYIIRQHGWKNCHRIACLKGSPYELHF